MGGKGGMPGMGRGCGSRSPTERTCSTSRPISRKPNRCANASEPSSSTVARAAVKPRPATCSASARSNAVPTPRRRAAGSTRGATIPSPPSSEGSATPQPASRPSSSASRKSFSGAAVRSSSSAEGQRSFGRTAIRTDRQASSSDSRSARRTTTSALTLLPRARPGRRARPALCRACPAGSRTRSSSRMPTHRPGRARC